jgi:hypothetical protein
MRGVAVLTTALVMATGPSAATASQADISTTRVYVQANYALVQYAAARLATARRQLDGVFSQVNSECPAAAAGSPQNAESTMVSYEIIGAMVLAAYHPALSQISAFVRVAARSRWSNRALSGAIHSYAAQLRTLTQLAAPKVCADIRSWAASGYARLPSSTVQFDQRFVPAWVALGQLPSQLGQYERSDVRGTLQRTGQLEAKLSNFEAEAVDTYTRLMNTLHVFP